jgi:hypothetical protein
MGSSLKNGFATCIIYGVGVEIEIYRYWQAQVCQRPLCTRPKQDYGSYGAVCHPNILSVSEGLLIQSAIVVIHSQLAASRFFFYLEGVKCYANPPAAW